MVFNRGLDATEILMPAPQDGMVWVFADAIFETGNILTKHGLRIANRSVCCLIEKASTKGKTVKADDALISDLSAAAGIQKDWWEVNGTHHQVSSESLRSLLTAMNLPTGNAREVKNARDQLQLVSNFRRCIADRAGKLKIAGDPFRAELVLCLENGERLKILKNAGAADISLPALPMGMHVLRDESGAAVLQILAHPAQCFLPDDLRGGIRKFGVGTHLYTLRDQQDWGIGDFQTLGHFAEVIARNGGSFAGINPLHHMFTKDRERASPYQPSDRRFLDPIYIRMDEASLSPELDALRKLSHVDYSGVWANKEKALRKQFTSKRTSRDEKSLRDFISVGGKALQQHGAFEGDADFAIWLQWLADKQLAEAATRAKSAGLAHGIYRDLALGCAYEGGELASDPDLFADSVSIGSPPDPFSATGQVWNLPPHNPVELRARNFTPFREILSANMRHAGMLRIDHVLGLARQFWVPLGASGADGAYVTMPMDDLMAIVALESNLNKCIIIGEDLGTVPDGLRRKMSEMQILSYKMLWFEREGDGFAKPTTYPQSALTCLSSHDLKPFRGWEIDAAKLEKNALRAVVGDNPDLMVAAHQTLAHAPSMFMQIQADDLAEEIAPLNVPGTDKEYPNWRRRIKIPAQGLFDSAPAQAVIAAVKSAQSEKS
jgi:4-alpha-glucanotransferase